MADRRAFLKTALVGAAAAPLLLRCSDGRPRWRPEAALRSARSSVAVLGAGDYERPLEDVVRRGLEMCGVDVAGRRIVLKPNLVEYDPDGVINTHPAVVAATLAVLRSAGAREVIVAEGPGHQRDTEYLLTASGLYDILREHDARYVDLNHDAVRPVSLRSSFTELGTLYLPATVLDADLLISMPKLKTHHWAGVTLSMKNLFGIVPGAVYGWPKNVLHWAGIPGSIIDVNSSITVPRFNIVDGVVGMEGDGPIMGTARRAGVLVFGADPVAVDATCSSLMGVDPEKVRYLRDAGDFLGNVRLDDIEQLGENPMRLKQDFELVDRFRNLRG
jgi:uncharacterized protein (DUF362 family)